MLGQTGKSAKHHAPLLRTQPTDAERLLWQKLRGEQLGVKFRRQHPYLDYVLDFVCIDRKLVIEVDGGQHLESERDRPRDRDLEAAGFKVLRFWNNDVLGQIDAVLEKIISGLTRTPSPPPPLPLKGRGDDSGAHAARSRIPPPPLPLKGRGDDGGAHAASGNIPPPPLSLKGRGDDSGAHAASGNIPPPPLPPEGRGDDGSKEDSK
jgi:very-short-patch-repair endonuclease